MEYVVGYFTGYLEYFHVFYRDHGMFNLTYLAYSLGVPWGRHPGRDGKSPASIGGHGISDT